MRRLALIALLSAAPLSAVAQQPMHGVALVIGESKYEQLPVLANPSKDARDIDRLLGDLGFEVDRVLNADGGELRDAIAQFEKDAKDADVALIYYSGHG
ncbi:MAG TPA: caspase family protein, partial [Devosia sp.]|nr:caspase family protein [Devosia sp.]